MPCQLKICLQGSEIETRKLLGGIKDSTGNDVYSGDHYSGNDQYSGPKTPDDAILFTVCGITAKADKKLDILMKKKIEPK